jgi:hypothetical protein
MALTRAPKHDEKYLASLSIEERKDLAPQLMADMHSGSGKIAPIALVTPLFSITRAKKGQTLPAIDVAWHTPRGNLRYVGPQLTQSHLTAYLIFANLVACGYAKFRQTFHPSELLRRMGWSVNPKNINTVRRLLDDLAAGQLRVWAAGVDEVKNAARVRLINAFTPSEDGPWQVNLSEDVLPHLFRAGAKGDDLTSIKLSARALLTEGLGTWLFGFIRAESCKLAFTYAQVHAASGSRQADMSAFGEEVRRVLAGLKAAGLIVDFTLHHGGFRVQKRAKK